MNYTFLFKTRSGQLTTLSILIVVFAVENAWYQTWGVFFIAGMILHLYARQRYQYWENLGITNITESFPFGIMKNIVLQRISFAEVSYDIYTRVGDKSYIGVYAFLQPELFIKDPQIIKNILVKDFNNFMDRGVYVNEKVDPLTGSMFMLAGQPWRHIRTKLSPTFTSGKLKTIYPTLQILAKDLNEYTANELSKHAELDAKDLIGRLSLDVIAVIALGLDGNNFKEYNTDMRKLTQAFIAPSTIQLFRIVFSLFCRDLASFIQMRLTPKEVEEYFFQVTKNTKKFREENKIRRNDFFQLLLELGQDDEKQVGNDRTGLTLAEMAAQSFTFVIAGYETTSTTLSFTLYELAMNPDVQEKLRQELDSVGPDVQYDELLQLPYLDMVLNETMRKHPSLPLLTRNCINDYELPDGKIIKAGTVCVIPVFAMHRDPELFPNPEKYDPERFNKENLKHIKPYTYLPFGEGPRMCIGMRFVMMQMKIVLATFLSRFRIEVSEKTPVPLTTERKTFTYNCEGGLWIRVIERAK